MNAWEHKLWSTMRFYINSHFTMCASEEVEIFSKIERKFSRKLSTTNGKIPRLRDVYKCRSRSYEKGQVKDFHKYLYRFEFCSYHINGPRLCEVRPGSPLKVVEFWTISGDFKLQQKSASAKIFTINFSVFMDVLEFQDFLGYIVHFVWSQNLRELVIIRQPKAHV